MKFMACAGNAGPQTGSACSYMKWRLQRAEHLQQFLPVADRFRVATSLLIGKPHGIVIHAPIYLRSLPEQPARRLVQQQLM